jgi:hypothetical protein
MEVSENIKAFPFLADLFRWVYWASNLKTKREEE